MGDMGPQLVMDLKTKSMNNIAVEETEEHEDESEAVQMSPEDLDGILVSLDSGLSVALQRAKVWSRYIADIITYIEKKAQLEYDYAKNLSRLANTVQNSLKKEGFLPLQSVYCTALSQDVEFASNLHATQSLLHSHKFVEPLSARRSEHDRVYKSVKDVWHREYKRMTDSVTNLRKAQALYMNRQQDHERAHELALKADGEKQEEKRRKAEEDAMHKGAEAETTYKACVAEANYRQQELFKVKGDQLQRIREQIQLCDQVIKDVTVEYFQLYHTVLSPLPLQYQTLSESSKNYEPGSQYAEYVRRLPGTNRPCQPEVFVFEPYIQGQKSSSEDTRKESVHSNGSVSDNVHSPEGSPVQSPRRDKYRIPVKAWGQQMPHLGTSDTDSASCSSKSHESSPSGSPHRGTRRLVSSQSLDELTEEEILAAAAARNGQERRTQIMKRTMTLPGEDSLDLPGLLLQHKGRRNTTFGVDFQEQVDIFHTKVPPIVSKCLSEIEKRGLMIKGIYRVSGVKSKVEHLCQRFDIDPEAVDLGDIHPNVISNVLKLYLRQLPEPLLTFRLYSDFIHSAKENMSGQLLGDHLIEHLKRLVAKLPSSNFRTCAVLMHHLQRVASHSELNQMSASNLGIVFGPTLLRPLEGSASLASLVDTPHQTRAIELLITHAHLIFGPSEDFQIAPSQTPIEQLSQALSGVLVPGQGMASDLPTTAKQAKTKPPSTASVEMDELSSSVFESASSPSGASPTQPSAYEFVLPGTASQERNESQSLAINGLDIEGSEWRSDGDEEDEVNTADILLPDHSKPQSDPLSVALSPRCIQVPGAGQETSRAIRGRSSPIPATTVSPSQPGGTSSQTKPAVTKSASSPVVSRSPKTHISPSKSVPETSPGSDMAMVLSASSSGMAASFMMSSGSYASSEMTSSGIGYGLTSSAESWDTEGESSISRSPQPIPELPIGEASKISEEKSSQSGSERSGLEELSKKKLHSQQLQNIKYLTKAPSVDESSSDFFPKATFTLAPTGSVGTPSQSLVQGPSLSSSSDQKDTTAAPTQPPDKVSEPTAEEKKPSSVSVLVSEPVSPLAVPRPSPIMTKVGSSRRSILEEVPIPTLSKPINPASDGSGGSDAVTIPASPTIKRRELPSKIPTSPSTQRSADSKQDGDKHDNRADKFRQEQRKLVQAIKSDAKAPTTETTTRVTSSSASRDSGVSSTKDSIRSSEVFDDIVSGGCALSSRPSSLSEELGGETKIEEAGTPDADEMDDSGPFPNDQQATDQASSSVIGQGSTPPLSTLHSSLITGRVDAPKPGSQSSPRERPASTGAVSSSGETASPRPTLGRARPLNMPSTCFVKKTTSASAPSTPKLSVSSAGSKTTTVSSITTKAISSATTASTRSSLPSRSKPASSPALTAGAPIKRTPSSSSADQSPQTCSRVATGLSKASDESSTSSKSSSPVSRKGSGRDSDPLSRPARLSGEKLPHTSTPPRPDGSGRDKPSSPAQQSSLSRTRHPSSEASASSSSSARPSKPVQRKPPSSSSGTPTGSPRKIHERCQQERPTSSVVRAGSQQGSTTPKSMRPSHLPTTTAAATTVSSATSSSSPATTPTSASGKLSQDRTPRFV